MYKESIIFSNKNSEQLNENVCSSLIMEKLKFNQNTVLLLNSRIISFDSIIPSKIQSTLLIQIHKHFLKSYPKKRLVILLHGPPGTGKSTIPYLLASLYRLYNTKKQIYESAPCINFNPTSSLLRDLNTSSPSFDSKNLNLDNFYYLYYQMKQKLPSSQKWYFQYPKETVPNIICMDEFDAILDLIINTPYFFKQYFNERAYSNYIDFRTSVDIYNKISWNKLFDDFNLGFYPNTILFLTTNHSPEEISQKYNDSSLLRKNRIDLVLEMNEKIV